MMRGSSPQSRARRQFRFSPQAWLLRHFQVALAALGRLTQAPVGTLMTTAVIGIALALPIGLYIILTNLQSLSGGWSGAATISLFLKADEDDKAGHKLAKELNQSASIDRIQVIERDQALAEFRQLSGFGDALKALQENPLPAVLVIVPTEAHSSPERVAVLVNELSALPQADFAQLDMQWVRRILAITEIAQRAVLVIAGLFSLAVLLIVGNTIRLEIQNRQEEIEITKLIGATNAFIRRPFLYSGLWYGLFGGILAWLLISLSLWLLSGPIERLSGLYHSQFTLTGMDLGELAMLLPGSALLGLLGSWLSVSRHLSAIQPH